MPMGGMEYRSNPVSYTHLDVYKRQGRVYNLENMAMRLRREIIRTVNPDEQGMFVVEVNGNLANYIVSRNNQNQAVLPHYENAHFFIRSVPNAHPEQIVITRITDKNSLSDTQVFC